MAAQTDDKFKKVGASTVTTLSAPGKAIGATSINVGSTTNYPTDTGLVVGIRVVDGNGDLVAGTYTEWNGVVTSGTAIQIESTPEYGTDQIYPAGSTTQVFLNVSSSLHNQLVDGILVSHNQDGTLITQAVRDALNLDSGSSDGWTPFGYSLTSITALGNRSYTAVVSGTDTTGVTSVGMRLKLPRTVTAPTQCTSLNGTTQYYNKTSPAGMTFTDDFTVSAWVKLSSYGVGQIASRYNGTSGWYMGMTAAGQVFVYGHNASAANFRGVTSYQSIPLNKWVHVTAQLDMSAYTSTTTTCYIMIDGVNVPTYLAQGGTNPTALVQAGNLEIGSNNGGLLPFPGKIAQVAIYSAKVTQATILASMNQTLTGSETSLVSAYTFNNSINDLSANANNLTAQGSAVATDTDTPFTNSVTGTSVTAGTTNYGIIMAQTFSTNTTYTIQIPEGETLPTTGGIGTVSYSTQKTPYGFPGQRSKWALRTLILADLTVGASATTWYTGTTASSGSFVINVPVGEWNADYTIAAYSDGGGNVVGVHKTTLGKVAGTPTSSDYADWLNHQDCGTITAAAGGPFYTTNHSKSGYISETTMSAWYGQFLFSGIVGNPRMSAGGQPSSITIENALL